MSRWPNAAQPDWLVVSDIDGTLLGDDGATARFADWYDQHRHRISLAYASGRLHGSVLEAIAGHRLPQPDAIISGVGTNIHCCHADAPSSPWPNPPRGTWCIQRIRQALAPLRRMRIQPDEFQSDFKVSYYLEQATPAELEQIARLLTEAGLKSEIIYSSGRDLDVLPSNVHKGAAARALACAWGFAPDHVIACGDTENDLSLFQQGFRGVVVGNATAGLRRGATSAYQARARCAAGVLEGLLHWTRLGPGSAG